MGNEEHLKILKQGVEAWNKWREDNPDVRPTLSGAILKRANLHSANLTEVNLTEVNLSFANLTEADLKRANLNGADLWNANLARANLTGAKLHWADLSKVDLAGANLTEVDLRGAKLSEAKLTGADLPKSNICEALLNYADLSRATLSEAVLSGANLHGADLCGAKLSEAVLSGAILCGADLRNANLSGANLSGANLSGADLGGAALFNAYLSRANLSRANLSGASTGYTSFANIDLSQTIGLKSMTHHGPSSVGIDTIYKSGGNIPEVFLRGCGVPENFITFHKSLVNSPIEFYSCFISYSHQDKSFARRLHDQLQMRGIRCWLDEKQMLPGDDIYSEVDRGIRLWDKVLLCASKHSLTSWWVDNEIDTAFEKERQLMKDRQEKILALIPLNLDGYMFNGQWKSGKEKAVKSRLAADFTGWEADNKKFEEQFELIVKALRTGDGGREQPQPPKI